MKMYILLAFLVFPIFLGAQENIAVDLRTQETLSPIYLSAFEHKQSIFSQKYITHLETILRSDLEKSGKARLLKDTKRRQEILSSEKNFKVFHQKRWLETGAFGVVKIFTSERKLQARIYNVQSNHILGTEDISLSGELDVDRFKMHMLADKITFALFSEPGIASSRILYTITRKPSEASSKDWHTEVWECDSDGANASQITHQQNLCITPCYIPSVSDKKAKAFLFVSYEIGQPKLFAAKLNDGVGKRLTYLSGNQLTPAISPKGDMIAFVSDYTGNPELFLMPFNLTNGERGKPRLIFASLAGAQGCPSFSPDGHEIAFVSNKDGRPRIYVMTIPKVGTGIAKMVTKINPSNTSPAWSPDGTKLAYSASTSGTRQIWIYDFETKQEKQLTDGNEHKENPSWAHNSLHLVYNTSTQEGGDLYLMNLADKKPIKITQGDGEKRFPSFN